MSRKGKRIIAGGASVAVLLLALSLDYVQDVLERQSAALSTAVLEEHDTEYPGDSDRAAPARGRGAALPSTLSQAPRAFTNAAVVKPKENTNTASEFSELVSAVSQLTELVSVHIRNKGDNVAEQESAVDRSFVHKQADAIYDSMNDSFSDVDDDLSELSTTVSDLSDELDSLTTSLTGFAFVQDGNAFGASATLGTTDNQSLSLITNGTDRLNITEDGKVGIGTSTPSGALDVHATITTGNASFPIASAANLNSTLNVDPVSDASLFYYYGSKSTINTPVTNSQPILALSGGFFDATHNGSGNFTVVSGIESIASNNSSTGLGDALMGASFTARNAGGGIVTNVYGLQVSALKTGAGTTTNAYGLYINNIQGTNTWGLYQSNTANRNYFAGNVNIGTTATNTSSKLTVVSTNVASTTLRLESPRVAIVSNNIVGGIDFASNDSNLTAPGTTTASILALANTTHTASALGTDLVFSTTNGTTTAERLRILGSGNIGIGTSTPSAKLTVVGTAQASILYSGTTTRDVWPSGVSFYATEALRSEGDYSHQVISRVGDGSTKWAVGHLQTTYVNPETDVTGSADRIRGSLNTLSNDPAAARAMSGVVMVANDNHLTIQDSPSAASLPRYGAAVSGVAYNTSARPIGNGTNGLLTGGIFGASNRANSPLSRLTGITASVDTTAGDVTDFIAGEFAHYTYGSGSIANAYGIKVGSPGRYGSATYTNAYGIRIDDQSALGGATNKYNFFSAGASSRNVFEGSVGIGTSSPISLLHVSGAAGEIRVTDTDSSPVFTLVNENSGSNSTNGTIAGIINFNARFNGLSSQETSRITGVYRGDGTTRSGELQFGTSDAGSIATRMTINAAGTVGIGTTTPSAKLHITGTAGTVDIFAISSSTNARLLTVTASGNLGIGTSTPSEMLTVAGNARITAVGSGPYAFDLNLTADGTLTTSASDRALKTQEELLSTANTLEKLLLLQPKSFVWKETDSKDIGLIAQEVEEVFPEIVFTNPVDGYMGINYSRLPALLIAGIQELAAKISELFARDEERAEEIENLEAQNAALNARVDALEAVLDIETESNEGGEQTKENTGGPGEPVSEPPVEPVMPPEPEPQLVPPAPEPEEPIEPVPTEEPVSTSPTP